MRILKDQLNELERRLEKTTDLQECREVLQDIRVMAKAQAPNLRIIGQITRLEQRAQQKVEELEELLRQAEMG